MHENQFKIGVDKMEVNKFLAKLKSYQRMQHANGFFEIAEDGVWFIKDNNDDKQKLFICSPIIILAKTRDDSSNGWGRLLQWLDDAGIIHTWAIPMQYFQTDGGDIRKALSDQGVTISVNGYERKLFLFYLANYPITQLAVCVNKIGWYRNQFILPNKTIGQNDSGEIVVYQSENASLSKYSTKGTLHEWQKNISILAENHPFLILAISLAFSGQLLEPLNQNGTGIHFKGKSSKGKSTAEFVACTVFGNPESYHCTWRNTGNALEQTAFMHNDSLLVLDEIGEVPNPKELGSIVYMLINGSGKGRMTKSLTLKDSHRWRIVFLSSGEKTLSEHMEESGQNTKLGHEIRMVNINVDDSPYGIFSCVDFEESAASQAMLLNSNSNKYYGVAGEQWLEYLTINKVEVMNIANKLLNEYSRVLTANFNEGHIIRVAKSFALVATAGELATLAGITSWKSGVAFNAIQTVFNNWITNLKEKGNYEEKEVLEKIKLFFIQNGSSRFEQLIPKDSNSFQYDNPQQRTIEFVGYWMQSGLTKRFYVEPLSFRESICKKLQLYNYDYVTAILKKNGWLDCEEPRSTKSIYLPNCKKSVRVMVFDFNVMSQYSSE